MSLIIEDGSGVTDANSYASLAQVRAYVAARGLALPVADADVEELLVLACDYLETLESKYKGSKTDATFVLAWPRQDVFLYNSATAFDKNTIPPVLIQAQCQLAVDANSVDLLPTGSGREVTSEKVDVIEVHYAETKGTSVLPDLNKANAILQPLLNDSAGFALTSTRI